MVKFARIALKDELEAEKLKLQARIAEIDDILIEKEE